MARYHCAACDSYETLTFFPDRCSWCGGSVYSGDLVVGTSDDAVIDPLYRLYGFDEEVLDPGVVVTKWMRGEGLTALENGLLAELSLRNRVEQLVLVSGEGG